MAGARITAIAFPGLAGGERMKFDIGFEGELAMALAPNPNGGEETALFDYRANVLLRWRIGHAVAPHLVLGGGGMTNTSPTNTVAEVFWGFGSTFDVGDDWRLRFDVRQDMLPRAGDGITSAFEATLGLSVALGGTKQFHEHHPTTFVPPPVPEKKPETTPPTSHNLPPVTFSEGPAKPPPLPADPNLDTDKDGIPDVKDKCPLDPETVNGFQDDDGCPDQIPQALTVTGPALKFAAGRAKLDAADETSLKNVIDVMVANADLKIVVIGHPETKDKKGAELAQRRAESVRWYLIEHGVADVSRVSSKVGDPVAKKGDGVIDLDIAK